MAERTVPGFHGAPAIAVLPFDNLSGDPEQEYFADGLAEDLITGLSAWGGFPVIARNSSFTYKGRAVDVKQVSRELGVRYVVEGSVRRSGGRVRINAQLIDASSGAHIWAERYDRELADVFAVQDEITEAVVAALYPALWHAERERVVRQAPRNFDAWDCLLRAWTLLLRATDRDAIVEARQLFERAAELDPGLSGAYCGIAATHWFNFSNGWSDSPERSFAEVEAAAKRAVELDGQSAEPHFWLGRAYWREPERAIAEFELATQLGPSQAFAHASLGMALAMSGRPDEGIGRIERAIRLSPKDPFTFLYLSYLAVAHFAAGRYADALEWARRSLERSPDYAHAQVFLVASYVQLGRIDEARTAAAVLRQLPSSPTESLSWINDELTARLIDGLRKAGLKEG
jgi:TolB-like protein